MPPRSVLGVIAVLFAFYICAGCGSVRPAAPIPTSSGLIIKTMTMPSGAVGTSYSYTLAAQGGLPPYSWSLTAGALPPGLQLKANTGLVAGTPSVAGTESIGFEVQDSGQHSASMTLTINIAAQTPSSPLGINTTTVPAGTILILRARDSVGFCHSSYVAECGGGGRAGLVPGTWSYSRLGLARQGKHDESSFCVGHRRVCGSVTRRVRMEIGDLPEEGLLTRGILK
jgi:hypothetical protein